MKNITTTWSLSIAILCSLAIVLTPATAPASPGHGADILPDDSALEAPQHDETEDEEGMTEAPSESSATQEADDRHESTTTTKSEAKKESSDKDAKTAAAEEKPAEKATHGSTSEHYAINDMKANGYPVAAGMTLGALVLFGLALRYL